MPAGTLDLLIEKGATFRHALLVRSGEGASAPAANLTGYTARMQIRLTADAADPPLLELTTANGRIAIDGAAGRTR